MVDTRKNNYKYCIVPMCKSTTIKNPNKIFFGVPVDVKKRKQWCELMKRSVIGPKTCKSVSEDHFDIENDTENFMKHRLVRARLKLKPDVYPHKFDCQKVSQRERHKTEADDLLSEDIIFTESVQVNNANKLRSKEVQVYNNET